MPSPTYSFYSPIDMTPTHFNLTQYTGGSVTNFTSTEVDVRDANGDTAKITGNNFSPFGPSGTVTGAVLRDSAGRAFLIATNLNLDLGAVYNDRNNEAALFHDLFDGPGVVINGWKTGSSTLVGGNGHDILRADGGADTLIGGVGSDVLSGGAANSVFKYNLAAESTPGAPDLIYDFHTGDKIDLSAIAKADHITFHMGATKGHTGDVVVSYDAVHMRTVIKIYTNGDSVPDMRIDMLHNHANLASTDFVGVGPPPPAAAPAAHQRFAASMAGFGAPASGSHIDPSPFHHSGAPMLTAPRAMIA